ncbi:hypothetical protein SAMN02910415_00110 [Basfia succiniciproducens]|uniref:Uncharacterized protein n=1 Tax=Mannheimia succiniciproducens (strain KCTC 0769BP / MBEL55E) TaxID=221988 RepID=Q65R55_MANSM|nr:hypothetical protein [Basfia succiniciproducens]AAU38555.1 unknown [[Mannheimia] succiniciproducens MBEL55E]SEP58445.1 hypothetical protein SAMN02910415_00110 [Basfia succiniciproducens]
MNLQKLLLTRRFISTMAYFAMQSVFFIYLPQSFASDWAAVCSEPMQEPAY